MKKRIQIVALVMVCALVALFGTACGKSSSKSDADKVKKLVKEALDSEDGKAAIKAAEATGAKMEILAEGTTIVYKYSLNETYSKDQVDSIVEGMLASESTNGLQETADDLKKECSALTALKVQYYNGDGSLMLERTYK